MSNALEIAQAAANELGLPEVETIYGVNANATERQLGALLNRVCKELNAEYEWAYTQGEFTIYLESPIETTGTLVEGSKIVTGIPSTAALSSAFAVQNANSEDEANLLQASHIVSIDSATQITLNQAAVASGTDIELEFVKDTYPLPGSFSRYISDTWWDRTNNWRLIGPISPQTSEYLRSGIVQTGPRRRWRQVGPNAANWQIWPPPFSEGDTPAILAFEYISLAWAADISGNLLETMTTDTDTPSFPEHVLVQGLKAAFWRIKGFDWEPMHQEFVMAARRAMSQDGSKPTIFIGSTRYRDDLLSIANVADGNFPGPGLGGWGD